MQLESQPYEAGVQRQVFVDWHLVEAGYGAKWPTGNQEGMGPWEMPHGIKLVIHKPRIDYEPIVSVDQPWEGSIHFHTTLFEDGGIYRLYYTPNYGGIEEHGHPMNAYSYMLAYAESNDGVNWVKPEVGSVDFQGSKKNNLVYGLETALDRPAAAGTVFKDPSAQPAERYKFVHRGISDGNRCVFGAVSPDGLHWEPIEEPILPNYMSDTQTIVGFDSDKGRYTGYFRGWSGNFDLGSGRPLGRRTIAYAETEDFRHWPVPQMVVAPDTYDTPGTDIYSNGYTPWPDAKDGHLMFPSYYERTDDINVVHMLTSRDGVYWERPTREPIMSTGDPGTAGEPNADWRSGVFAGAGLASLSPGEVSLPVTPTWRSHNNAGDVLEGGLADSQVGRDKRGPAPGEAAFICLATWRTDGFTSIEAESEGAFTTIPFVFTGGRLQLNTWTRFGGEVRVELLEAPIESRSGNFLPAVDGRAFEDSDPISGDHLDHTVTWNGESDISGWAGRTVRLRFRMRRARLHSFHFV